MRYFKAQNTIMAIGENQEYLITSDWIELTIDEVYEINITKAKEDYESLSYLEKRKKEYPPIEEYLDAVVKSDNTLIQAYKDKCLDIKRKYPKN